MTIYPVILCGGSGSRLWPMSRTVYPKQFMALGDGGTLFQETLHRLSDPSLFAASVVICNEEHRFIVGEQLRQAAIAVETILLEPVGRNTAPAAAAAAIHLSERHGISGKQGDPLMLLAAADHFVGRPERLLEAIRIAQPAAEQGALVTFGIRPTRPDTAYGYIRIGEKLPATPGVHRVERFVEKPSAEVAVEYLESGAYLWNSGIFLMRAGTFLAELEKFEPAIAAGAREAVRNRRADLDFWRLADPPFSSIPNKSIDYAVMEHTDRAAVVPTEGDLGWSDVGSWASLWDVAAHDASGNAISGDVTAIDVSGSYIRGERRLIAAFGIRDLVIVDTEDALLVMPRDRTQELRVIVQSLQDSKRSEAVVHRRVYRPWGSYEQVDAGDRFQVKRLIVRPGGQLSLQRHAKRAEHWVVVRGRARVTRGDEVFDLDANQSTYIPVGTVHRLENRGEEPLHLIEVQSGGYLGEDDIERLDDSYGRR
ncbi:MAG: mannose-1-phosphate guanylyltransferase/mannose-6-phosphate isomerase [Dongiaceae bacterium]